MSTAAIAAPRFNLAHAFAWGLCWLALTLAFWTTSAVIVDLWIRSDTYAHAFLVFPIVGWLIWRDRAKLAAAAVRPMPWLLAPMAVVMFGWLLSEAAAVGVVGHFALSTMLVLAVPTLFGVEVARAMAFPLAFVYFAVPFGDALMPLLMERTADVTVWALRASGIPVYREGLVFVIPSGTWSVVEACSGLRYLIASLMVGSLFAHLSYTTLRKRLLFGVASIVVPIVANWARAYMIVMIGHLSSNRLAAGVDHLIYGWVFFGLIIGAMFWVGARFADPPLAAQAGQAMPVGRAAASIWLLFAAVLALAGVARTVDMRMDASLTDAPARLVAPVPQVGWQVDAGERLPWAPGFRNPVAVVDTTYQHGNATVHLWIGYYRRQGTDSKLVSSVNTVVRSGEEQRDWALSGTGLLYDPAPSLPYARTADVRPARELGGPESSRFRSWHLYWVDGRWSRGGVEAKLLQALARLQGRGDDGAVVLLATPAGPDADATLRTFLIAHREAIERELVAARLSR